MAVTWRLPFHTRLQQIKLSSAWTQHIIIIVTVTGKLSVKAGYFSFLQNLGPPGFCDCDYVCIVCSRVPQLEKWFWIVYCCASPVAVHGKQTLRPIWVSRLNFRWNSQRQQQVGSNWRMSPELNCPIVLNMITNTNTQNTTVAYAVKDSKKYGCHVCE